MQTHLQPTVPSTEESAPAAEAEEEDGPLEDWTKKELADECKTLGLSDKGKKPELIERIKEDPSTFYRYA